MDELEVLRQVHRRLRAVHHMLAERRRSSSKRKDQTESLWHVGQLQGLAKALNAVEQFALEIKADQAMDPKRVPTKENA